MNVFDKNWMHVILWDKHVLIVFEFFRSKLLRKCLALSNNNNSTEEGFPDLSKELDFFDVSPLCFHIMIWSGTAIESMQIYWPSLFLNKILFVQRWMSNDIRYFKSIKYIINGTSASTFNYLKNGINVSTCLFVICPSTVKYYVR